MHGTFLTTGSALLSSFRNAGSALNLVVNVFFISARSFSADALSLMVGDAILVSM
jgi:hypothetical protein